MDNAIDVVGRLGGVAASGALLREGVTRHALESALHGKALVKVARGVYALPDADPLLVHAARHHAVAGCVTAARNLGLWVVRAPEKPHLAAPHGRPVPGCIVHRSKLPLTSLDIVSQALRCLPPLEALTIAESAVKKGMVGLGELRGRFQAPREQSILRLVRRIRPQSASIIETVARYLLEEAGFVVEIQVCIRGMGHLDLMVDGVLGIETDGYDSHNGRDAYREDRRRWNITVVSGVPTLRVTYEMVMGSQQEFLEMIAKAVQRYGSARRA
jgi:hypothetical protein